MNKILRLMFIPLLLAMVTSLFSNPKSIVAQSESAYDLINAVNSLRTSRGSEPYQIDSGLMAYAQQHADYMASIQSATHTHSDGSVPWDNGIQENVATGTTGIMTISIVINQIWSDWGHWRVMVDYASGAVGAGITTGSDGMTYYVLNVRPATSDSSTSSTLPVGNTMPVNNELTTATVDWIVPLIKSTPNAEGEIIHEVGNGQSLWDIAIAYDVKIDDIRLLNNMAMDSTIINVGQQLLIMRVTVSPTLPEVEATVPVQEASATPTATVTPSPIAISTIKLEQEVLITPENEGTNTPETKNQIFYALITIAMVGLLFFSFFGFMRVKENLDNEKSTKDD